MRNIALFLTTALLFLTLSACQPNGSCDIVATTLPVYEFTQMLCKGTGLHIERLITENVSCLHNYTLKVDQMRLLEQANLIIVSGAGFEDFLDDVLTESHKIIDSSININTLSTTDDDQSHMHDHSADPHIWLSPANAQIMAENICIALTAEFPQHQSLLNSNLLEIRSSFDALQAYANENLTNLSTRKIITFHDGFTYMADAFSFEILHTVEEESGSEASAAELKELINIINSNKLTAIFTECNGSSSAANVIARETGCTIYTLDMAISGNSYFESMYYNIDALKEALE